jgi:hypothetical protein
VQRPPARLPQVDIDDLHFAFKRSLVSATRASS